MPNVPDPVSTPVPRTKITDALVRMARAVQKATIYPEGHPAVPRAVGPFLETLKAAMEERSSLQIGIAGDRLIIDGDTLEEKNGILSWFAQHLYERGVGAIDFSRHLGEDEGVRFALWLAKAEEIDVGPDGLPVFDGISLTRFDLNRLRFGEDPEADLQIRSDPVRLWRALMSGLLAGWEVDPEARLPDDPEEAARAISARIARREGVGATALASRVIAMGAELPTLPEPVRLSVKKRLGTFIGGLSPELRTQLLRVDQESSRQKFEFVTEMLDALPEPTVMEILGGLDRSGRHVPHQFITLMNKMITLSAKSRSLAEGVGAKIESFGLPRAVMAMGHEKVRDVLSEVLQSRLEKNWNPEHYQALLETLSTRHLEAGAVFASDRYGDPRDPHEVTSHVSRIALRLLMANPESPEAAGYVRQLGEDAKRALESGRYEQVHEAAAAIKDLTGRAGGISGDLERLAQSYIEEFGGAERVEKVLEAAESRGIPVAPAFVGLFRLCGSEGTYAAFQRLAERVEGPEAECMIELLIEAEPEAFAAAVARVRQESWSTLRVLFPILQRIGGQRAVELALTFLGNEDPRVRIEAFRILLAADQRPGQAERYVERGLADENARVAAFIVAQARQRGGPAMTALIGAFLRRELGGSDDVDLRVKAIAALAAFKTEEARDILIGLLSERRIALFINQVKLIHALEAALLQIGDEPSIDAVNLWRRSAKRRMSMFLVTGKVENR